MFVWIDIVGRKMEPPGFFVNHPAAHRDCVLEHFVGDPDLLQCVNAARGKREIDRASADHVAFARISPALVKIDIVSPPTEISREQSTGQATSDEHKFCFRAQSKKARTKSGEATT